jgi:uncharacterized SAM-dependent methyltransferase
MPFPNEKTLAGVAIHPSQFPQAVQREMARCLRERCVNPKFHYLTYKQAERWLALHEAHSPARTDAGCAGIYDTAFAAAAEFTGKDFQGRAVELVALGCGGGQKDSRLVQWMPKTSPALAAISCILCDVSVALVLTASDAVRSVAPGVSCHPLVCDLAEANDLQSILAEAGNGNSGQQPAGRIVTFFGMVPNFEPETILPRLATALREGDVLLMSANLAPGADYDAGMRVILPGYDNALTRAWLMVFLTDLGVEPADGDMRFGIEAGQSGLKRVVADFVFSRALSLSYCGETFRFALGESIRLFYSYRYTPDRLGALLEPLDINILDQWIAPSGEEGVFLCRLARRA